MTSANTDSQLNVSDSLLNLIQKNPGSGNNGSGSDENGGQGSDGDKNNENGNPDNNGGNKIPSDGGQQTTLNPSQSEALFTTSLKDGDEVDGSGVSVYDHFDRKRKTADTGKYDGHTEWQQPDL